MYCRWPKSLNHNYLTPQNPHHSFLHIDSQFVTKVSFPCHVKMTILLTNLPIHSNLKLVTPSFHSYLSGYKRPFIQLPDFLYHLHCCTRIIVAIPCLGVQERPSHSVHVCMQATVQITEKVFISRKQKNRIKLFFMVQCI